MSPRFEIGLRAPLEIREEVIGEGDRSCRIAYVSDIHLRKGRSRWISGQVIDALERSAPDLILLGGDLVDQASETDHLVSLVARARGIASVLAVPGNHDISVGKACVRSAVEAGGGTWIEGKTARFIHEDRVFAISGTGAGPASAATANILCTHHPRIGNKVWKAGFDLALAGHLHGCQCVLFESAGLLFPGAFFYPDNRMCRRRGKTRLVISRGCSDLIPIRWNCPREMILCIVRVH
jgi:predicted MPP superfamily phosphohydrolase